MIHDEKPTLEELRHHGVLGMKWGKHRAKANTAQIKIARSHVYTEKAKLAKQEGKVARLHYKDPKKAGEAKTLAKMQVDFLKNPDRVTAARMTRGEKAIAGIFVLSGVGTPIAIAAVAGTSARSRRIEQKQIKGKYDKK